MTTSTSARENADLLPEFIGHFSRLVGLLYDSSGLIEQVVPGVEKRVKTTMEGPALIQKEPYATIGLAVGRR